MGFHRLPVVALFLSLVPAALLMAQTIHPPESAMYGRAAESDEWVAQQGDEDPASRFVEPQEFGTSDSSWITVGARAFRPYQVTTVMASTGFGMVYRAEGPAYITAAASLPSGVLVEGIEWQVCDTSTTAGLMGDMWRMETSGAGNYLTGYPPITTAAEDPGCVRRYIAFSTPITVDNDNYTYGFELSLGATDISTRLAAVRIRVKRQIAPAPMSATFNDVANTHPFYQHIEALVASGITGGCGNGNYCPNDPVTRGQMAVFLAKALGLHWVP